MLSLVHKKYLKIVLEYKGGEGGEGHLNIAQIETFFLRDGFPNSFLQCSCRDLVVVLSRSFAAPVEVVGGQEEGEYLENGTMCGKDEGVSW